MAILKPRVSEMPDNVEDIKLIREIGRGTQCVVFLGERASEKFAVKILSQSSIEKDPDSIQRFYREAGILARCAHSNLAKILKVSDPKDHVNPTYLIMELLEGNPLSTALEQGPMLETRALKCIHQVALALREVHRFGLIHRDLKPKNIILGPKDVIKVIDFGLAASQQQGESSEIVGTFLYSSPEQTGLLKRTVDHRSDLYSLGIVLFECLAGRPPYQSANAGELMHMHLSSPIPDLKQIEPSLSAATAQLVKRLMAKDPDDRYRSTSALIQDLEWLISLRDRLSSADPSQLSKGDSDDQDMEALPIVGREAEIVSLKERAHLARLGHGQIILIRGESGTGKSRLARELVQECRKAGATNVLSTKASMSNSLPFGAIREALHEYFKRLNGAAPELRLATESRIRKEIGDRIGLLVNFSPILGKFFTDVAKTTIEQIDQEKFFETLADLLLCLGQTNELFVLLLDDVQWLDESSVRVLRHVARKSKRSKILLLMSARVELGGADAIQKTLEELAEKQFAAISLGTLDLFSTRSLVSQCLGGAEVEEALLKNVFTRSNGNAFAVQQFVSAMIDGGILLPSWGTWRLSAEGLENLKLPSDVIQLLLQRTKNLSEDTKLILKYAAVLSEEFDSELLASISNRSPATVDRALADASEMKLVEIEMDGKMRFVHDKVREAFASLWSADDRAYTHQAIADLLFARNMQDDSDVFSIANHYRQGLLNVNPERTFNVGHKAALAASQNLAHQEALEYFKMSDQVATFRPDLRHADFEEAFGLCFMIQGKFVEAERHFTLTIDTSASPVQRARVYCKMIKLANARGAKAEAWDHANAGFAELNVSPAKKGPRLIFHAIFAMIIAEFIDRFIGVLPAPKDPEKRERIKVLAELSDVTGSHAYFDLQAEMMILVAMRSAVWARRLGVSRELSYAYCHNAMLSSLFRLKKRVIRYAEKAMAVANSLHDPSTIAYAQIMVTNSWLFMAEDELFIEKRYRQAFDFAFKWGDSSRYISATGGLLQRMMRRGLAKNSFELINLALQKVNSPESTMEMLSYRLGALSMCGRIREASELYREMDEFSRTRASQAFKALHTLNEGIYLLEQNEFGERADRFLEDYERSGFRHKGGTGTRSIHFPGMHIRLNQWMLASPEDRPKRFEQLLYMVKNARKYGNLGLARRKPELLTETHATFIDAAIARVQGNLELAHKLLDSAENMAVKSDCQWILFEVLKQRALAFKDEGYSEAARQYFTSALGIAVAQGWEARASRLRKEHEIDLLQSGSGSTMTHVSSTTQVAVDDTKYLLLQKQLNTLLTMGVEASKVTGMVARCRVVLKEIIGLLNPERAFLFLFDKQTGESTLQIGQDVAGNVIEDISQYSSSIVDKVRTQIKPLVVTGSDQGGDLTSESIVAFDLRSIMAAPLTVDGKLIGVIYLDSRVAKGIFKEKDVQVLLAFGDHIAVAIETARASQLEVAKNSMQKDLEVAGAVQTLLLPKLNSTKLGGLEAHSYFETAEQAGGDWWCFDHTEDGKLRILLGDVTGHGAGSAMLTAVVGSCYHTVKELVARVEIPRMAEILNKTLVHFCAGEYWMTFSAIEIDPETGNFDWWNMGSPPLIKYNSGKHELIMGGRSMPLGSGELQISCQKGNLQKDDQLMIFSDGLFEFKSVDGKDFGMRKLFKLYKDAAAIPGLEDRANFLVGKIRTLRGTPRPPDDVTFSIVQYTKK